MTYETRRYDAQGYFVRASPEKFLSHLDARLYLVKDDWPWTVIVAAVGEPIIARLSGDQESYGN